MQELLQAVLLTSATALLCVLLRSLRPEYAVFAGIAGSVGVLLLTIGPLRQIASALRGLSLSGEIDGIAAQCLRAAAVVLACEFASALCRTAGEELLAGRIEFFGRALLCAMCVPVALSLIDTAGSLSFSG